MYFYFTYSHISSIKNNLNKFLKDCSINCSTKNKCTSICFPGNIFDIILDWNKKYKIDRPNIDYQSKHIGLEDKRNIEIFEKQKKWNIFVGLRNKDKKKKKLYVTAPEKFALLVFNPERFNLEISNLSQNEKQETCNKIQNYLKIIDKLYKVKTAELLDYLCLDSNYNKYKFFL